jgi:hypothetical protein
VADIIRRVGTGFRDSLTRAQRKVLNAIVRFRTAALGGHRDQCLRCGYQVISFFSCRNRHCPKCQVNAREKWLRKRQQELLAVRYYHIIFSVPHRLIPVMWQNKKLLFSLSFQATASALMEVASDPKRLGAEIGFLSILHTWGQTWKDCAHNNQLRTMTLTCEEFLRRFLQHVLPKGLPRIRYFGWLANRRRAKLLPLCRALLHQQPAPTAEPDEPQVPHCPRCHGEMCIIERLSAAQIRNIVYRMEYALDTS